MWVNGRARWIADDDDGDALESVDTLLAMPERVVTEVDDDDDVTGLETVPERDDSDLEGPLDEYDFDAEVADEGEWSPELGFPDPFGILRIWVDDDNVISRVRMTPHWRARLGANPLADAFGQTFLLINNHRRSGGEPLPAPDKSLLALEPLTWQALADSHQRLQQLKAELSLLPDEVSGQWQGEGAQGEGAKGKLRIMLTVDGLLEEIIFHEKWLTTARIKEISDAVVEAHRTARARFVPPTFAASRREEIQSEMVNCRDEILALMRRGFF